MPLQIPPHHRNMRGNGIGSILRSLTSIVKPVFNSAKRNLIPLAKRAGKELKTEGISFLKDTGKDLLSGNNLESAVKKNFHKSRKRVIRKVKKKIGGKKRGAGKKTKGSGGKRKTGSGKKKSGKGFGKKATGGKRKKTAKQRKKTSIFEGY